jgi:hypothetical protein
MEALISMIISVAKYCNVSEDFPALALASIRGAEVYTGIYGPDSLDALLDTTDFDRDLDEIEWAEGSDPGDVEAAMLVLRAIQDCLDEANP